MFSSKDLQNKIFNSDCLDGLRAIADSQIDLVVTSPPYYNARSYSQYASFEEYIVEFNIKNIK